jgi:DNA polymerase
VSSSANQEAGELAAACAAPEVALDFETAYGSGYSVQELGYSAYVRDPRFRALMVAVSNGQHSAACHPQDFPWHALHGKILLAHNAAFDLAVFERLRELGIIPPTIQPLAWHDTAALCTYAGAPRALDEAADVLLGLKIDKAVRQRMANGGDLFDAVDDYAATDAKAAALLWQKLAPHWPERERRLATLTSTMGFRGITLDQDRARKAFEGLETQADSARMALPWFPKQAAGSTKAIDAECKRHNIPPPDTTSAKDGAFDAWLEQHGETEPARYIRLVQEIRSLNRAARVLETMLSRVRPDGRIDAHTMYFGAATGRWSGGGHGLNLQNLNRAEAGNADLRACLVAAPGHKLVIVDLAQIEPRCLAWMAGDRAWLDLIRAGMNPYEAHARTAHGWSGTKLKSERPTLYALCKAERLGLGYGCGQDKFVTVAKALGGLTITVEESRKIVQDFRRTNPAITGLWNRLEAAFKRRHGQDYRLPLPSGRKLRYFDVDAEDMTAAVVRGGPRYSFYGGKLCENLIQAMARDVFAEGLLRVEDAGLNPILTVHDEVICEVPEAAAADALPEIIRLMTVSPVWAPDLPIEAEGCLADHYRK